jgi:hypothetical protein
MYVPNALAGNGFCGADKDVIRNTERGRRSGRLKLGQCLAEPGKRDECQSAGRRRDLGG